MKSRSEVTPGIVIPFDRLCMVCYKCSIYLFIMNNRTIHTLCKKEGANKVIKNYDNAKCEIKSHTSSYANMLPSEQ